MSSPATVQTQKRLKSPPKHWILDQEVPEPNRDPNATHIGGWFPDLNPTQQEVFDELAKYVLAYGEKGSGKSIGCLHALIRHCYEEEDALALIIAPQIRTGKEGVIYDLLWCCDIWKNGNYDPTDPDRVRRKDDGMGLDYTDPTLDPNTKDRIIFIGNIHGGWSKVILMSIPYEEVVEKRMKALSPSFIYADEITELEGKKYFTYVAQQRGRRRKIRGPQQYLASCNPEGPSHWVYKVWWEDCLDKKTGRRHPDFEVYHVPITENKQNLPPGYVEGLLQIYTDPFDIARLVEGRWIDRPSGDAIFKNYWRPEIHIRGDYLNNIGLKPRKEFPMIVSYDPGPVNFCVAFMQLIPTKTRPIWIVFDELNFVGEFMADFLVVRRILERMEYWNKEVGGKPTWVHISDEASFTHKRPDGTYDATRILQLSNGQIRLRACPKGKESVPSRVQMINTMLLSESMFVSAMCRRTIEMFRLLVSEKVKEGKYDPMAGLTPKRSPYLHPFDAVSYGPYYFTMHPAHFAAQVGQVSEDRGGGVYRAGSG